MKHKELFSASKLPEYSKDELFEWIHDCSDLDRGELDAALFQLRIRLDQSVTRLDKIKFLLLACSEDEKQKAFGTGMMVDYLSREEAVKYWTAVYYFGAEDAHHKSVAGSAAFMNITKLCAVASIEEVRVLLENLKREHEVFLNFVALLKNRALRTEQIK